MVSKEAIWSPEKYIGMTAKEVALEILRLNNPEIVKIKLVGYLPREKPRESLEELIETGIPDEEWDVEQPPWWVKIAPARESPEAVIQKILGSSSKLISVLSKAETLSPFPFKQIPMIDFKCSVSQENLGTIKEFLRLTGQSEGFLLNSGNSFHYYGSHLFRGDEWQAFMGRCLLSGLVEPRYVGHSLTQGAATLRISTSPLKLKEPEVVATL